MVGKITSFSGPYRFLSNFYPCNVIFEDVKYPSVEHAYQAAKTTDKEARKRIAKLFSPGRAKQAGRRLDLRQDWEQIKLGVMGTLVDRKFRKDPRLRRLLLETGDARLEEGNNWGDTFWGTVDGKGENHLGRILMAVRDKLSGL